MLLFVVVFDFALFLLLKWLESRFEKSLKKSSALIKGEQGEKRVSQILSSLNRREYKILNDVLLRSKKNATSQIDHIIVSVYGIFAVETKNYSGAIFGSEDLEYWTQKIHGREFSFKNPIKQNQTHIRALKKTLADFKIEKYFSIIAFAGSADLSGVSAQTPVVYADKLAALILSLSSKKRISKSDVQKIYSSIKKQNITDKKSRRAHIQNVQKAIRRNR